MAMRNIDVSDWITKDSSKHIAMGANGPLNWVDSPGLEELEITKTTYREVRKSESYSK